jgi:hypothetical protein
MYFISMLIYVSGSTATILRIPAINASNDMSEFLYATLDVAIWSATETGINLATSAAATLRPLLRQVSGDAPSYGSSVRRQSPSWKRSNPTRSGYLEQSSQGERQSEHVDIQLAERDLKFNHVHTITVGATSPYGSTAELNSFETEENQSASASPSDKEILRTVKVTQL